MDKCLKIFFRLMPPDVRKSWKANQSQINLDFGVNCPFNVEEEMILPWSEPSLHRLGRPGTCSCRTWKGHLLWSQPHNYRVQEKVLLTLNFEKRLDSECHMTVGAAPCVSGAVGEEIDQAGKEVCFWGGRHDSLITLHLVTHLAIKVESLMLF